MSAPWVNPCSSRSLGGTEEHGRHGHVAKYREISTPTLNDKQCNMSSLQRPSRSGGFSRQLSECGSIRLGELVSGRGRLRSVYHSFLHAFFTYLHEQESSKAPRMNH
jgi:hypothetical protein